jgi:hypothetical protein
VIKQINKAKQKGLSLIEASMVLVLSAVVVAGVMVYYQTAETNNNLDKFTSQIMHVVSEINGLYAGAAKINGGTDYSGLTTETVLDGVADQERVVSTDGSADMIKTAFPGTTLYIQGMKSDPTSSSGGVVDGTPADRFVIMAAGEVISPIFCTKLVSINFGSQAESFFLSDTTGNITIPTSKPLSERLALCKKLSATSKNDQSLGVVFK